MSSSYHRVILIGNSGSGKSTLAQKIGDQLDLPVHHLDIHFWGPNWQHPHEEEWRGKLLTFLKEEKWVIEGGINNLESRVEAADLILYFDFPTWLCLYRCLRRYVRYLFESEPLLPPDCKNKLTWFFIKYILTFHTTRRKMIEETLEKYKDSRKILTFKTQTDVDDFELSFLKHLTKG